MGRHVVAGETMAGVGVQVLGSVFQVLVQIGWIWLVLLPLEIAWPRAGQISARSRLKGVAISVVYWVLTGASYVAVARLMALLGLKPLLTLHVVPATVLGWTLYALAGTLVGWLSFEFLYYWFHRAQHTRLLWRVHAVHHAIEDLNTVNAYPHWLEDLSRLPFVAIPTALIVPIGLPALPWYGLSALHSVYIHTQTRLHFGPLWRVCMDNRFHRLHHSIEPKHFDKNFGLVTPLWDWLFGTLYVPSKDEWPKTGLAEAPEVDGLADFLWRPFRPTMTARPQAARLSDGSQSSIQTDH